VSSQICSFCGGEKPATREYFGSNPQGGLRRKCRTCMNAYSLQYGAEHRDRQKQRNEVRQARGGHIRLTEDEQIALLARQGRVCLCCGERIGSLSEAQVDHIVPVSQGGSHDVSNIALAHGKCNAEKHGKSLDQHWQWRQQVGLPMRHALSMLELAAALQVSGRRARRQKK